MDMTPEGISVSRPDGVTAATPRQRTVELAARKMQGIISQGGSMRAMARLAVFGVAALLATRAGAQTAPQPAPGQAQPAPGDYPYAPPPGFDASRIGQPQQAPSPAPAPVEVAPEATAPDQIPLQGPAITEVPDGATDQGDLTIDQIPPVDLGPDDAIADSYDDGYDPNAYTEFQDALAPYGSWVDDPDYGHVWTPASAAVGDDFAPYYSAGHWILTEYGWTWVSDWGWGWAPFHYGRWLVIAGRGWCWMPGTTWGPAWVSWRSGGGYVGWAPLPPRGVSVPAAGGGQRSPWRFTVASNLSAPHATGVPPVRLPGIFNRTSVVATDRLLSRGPYTVHVNAGPVRIATMAPSRLATVAPRALPRLAILPRPGTSVGSRPWIRPAQERAFPAPAASRLAYAPRPGARDAHAARSAPQTAMRYPPLETNGHEPAAALGTSRGGAGAAYAAAATRGGDERARAPRFASPSVPVSTPARTTSNWAAPSQPSYLPQRATYSAPAQPSFGSPRPASSAPAQPSFGSPRPAYSAPAQPSYAPARPAYQPAPAFQAPGRAPAAPTWSPAPHTGNAGGGAPFGGGHIGAAPAPHRR
jgi:hypothetical protein